MPHRRGGVPRRHAACVGSSWRLCCIDRLSPPRPYVSIEMSLLLKHGTLATMVQSDAPYGLIADGAALLEQGRIAWVGASSKAAGGDEVVDLEGRLVTPGLIDCHTHLVYAGSRSDEFEARLKGKSYAEIAQAGGGILSTVRATRAADEATLTAHSLP